MSFGLLRGVGEDHGMGFEALGAVHGHDAHLVAPKLHVALHLRAGRAQPGDEALQRRAGSAPLVVEREIEEFVERIVGFEAEPGEKALAAAAGTEQPGIEGEGAFTQGSLAPLLQLPRSFGIVACFLKQRIAQRQCAPVPGDVEQLLLGHAEERTFQHGGEREVVLRQQQCVGERDQVHDRGEPSSTIRISYSSGARS